jgi:hypothetical protein
MSVISQSSPKYHLGDDFKNGENPRENGKTYHMDIRLLSSRQPADFSAKLGYQVHLAFSMMVLGPPHDTCKWC